jgi:hypothetical protein
MVHFDSAGVYHYFCDTAEMRRLRAVIHTGFWLDKDKEKQSDDAQARSKPRSQAAERALAEAAERRAAAAKSRAAEVGGRDGPDPIRYGDWEVKGIASDF